MTDSIFKRLQYNYSGTGVSELSSNAISFMDTIPTLLKPWQIKDISDNNVGGYQQNPVASSTQSIRNKCNNLVTLLSGSSGEEVLGNTIFYSAVQGTTSEITSLFTSMNSLSANVGGTNGEQYLAHTNRIAGVTPLGADADILPYYQTATSIGQTLMYLTRQSDGVSNNAPIMGSFTSLFVKDQIISLDTAITSYHDTIDNSITVSTGVFDPEANSITYTRTSNLSYSVVSAMQTNINTINNTMAIRRSHDEVFFQNSKQVVDEYNTLSAYSSMGESANGLCQNYVGTSKLLSRINS